MLSTVSESLSSANVVRQTVAYVSSTWGDDFLNYEFEPVEKYVPMEKEAEELKKNVMKMLLEFPSDSFNQLKLIDDIQRLGVEYHFDKEIDDALEVIFAAYLKGSLNNSLSSHHLSLRFRLLRQRGFNVSCDTLNTLKDEDGKFKEVLKTDVEGLLSLYEASFLSMREENLLDEALIFSTAHLKVLLKHVSYPLSDMIARALDCPLWKRVVRVNAAHFISIYKDIPSHNENLLRFAKIDYNLLQCLHKKELSDMNKWTRSLDFSTKLPFARDRIAESCYWVFGAQFEPQNFLSRRIVCKVFYMVTVIDDVYDAYGTMEELTLFTEAVTRWSSDEQSQLPEYMQVCYQALLDSFKEIEECMIKQRTSYRYSYAKEAMINQVRSYYEEAKWLDTKYKPTFDEYISLASKSIGYSLISLVAFAGMTPEAAKKDDFDWVVSEPKFLKFVELICRLLDDLVSCKLEKQRAHIPTSVECYASQYKVSEDEAVVKLKEKLSSSWKDINKEMMRPTAVARPLLTRILHLARAMEDLYQEEDSYTNFGKTVQDRVSAMFANPIPL